MEVYADNHPRRGAITPARLLPAIVLLLAVVRCGMAQSVSVTVLNELNIGTLHRMGRAAIDYRSVSAAAFVVEGERGRAVRLTVTAEGLAQLGDRTNRGEMALFLANGDCAYSLDGGGSWQTFSSGYLMQDLVFPDRGAEGLPSRIYVRVGGGAVAGPAQHRGRYTGTITLRADYP